MKTFLPLTMTAAPKRPVTAGAANRVVVAVVAPAAVTVMVTTAAEIAVRIRSSPCVRDNRPGHENLTGSDLKSLTRSNARSSRP